MKRAILASVVSVILLASVTSYVQANNVNPPGTRFVYNCAGSSCSVVEGSVNGWQVVSTPRASDSYLARLCNLARASCQLPTAVFNQRVENYGANTGYFFRLDGRNTGRSAVGLLLTPPSFVCPWGTILVPAGSGWSASTAECLKSGCVCRSGSFSACGFACVKKH